MLIGNLLPTRIAFVKRALYGCVSILIALTCTVHPSRAQPLFDVTSTIRSCDDYATKVLNNPWDMSDPADINHFTSHDVVDIKDTSFSNGLFKFANAQTAGGHFYLLSALIHDLQPVGGRWGQRFPIDTTRFRNLTVRMNGSNQEATQYGIRVVWHRGRDGTATAERTITPLGTIPISPGWRNYSLDLSTVSSFDATSRNARPWTSSEVHGFGLYPQVSLASAEIDFIRLEDPSSCESISVAYTSSSSGTNDLLSFYLDDDSSLSNGYVKKIATSVSAASNGSLSISSLGVPPGNYRLIALFDSDYASLEGDNPWDMSESSDISSSADISPSNWSNGAFEGTISGDAPNIFFAIPSSSPINASTYTKLSLKIETSTNTNSNPMLLYWTRADGGAGFTYLTKGTHDANNDSVYHLNLAAESSWTGLITSLRLQVATVRDPGETFSLDFLQIRKTGLVTTPNVGSTIVSANTLTVSDPPRIQVLQPDIKGGELFKAWDIRSGDIGLSYNSDTDTDPFFPSEPRTAYLPDVRSIGGTRGNIYKSTNIPGNGDPNEYLNFPSVEQNSYLINADQYTNLCVRMSLNRDYNITLGSITKYFFKRSGGEFQSSNAWATIYDRWSDNRWYEYCIDTRNYPTDTGTYTWGGMLEAFRIDPHEFSYDSCCDENALPIGNPIQVTTYYDYIRLAKRDTSYGLYTLAWQSQDGDTANPSVTWEYDTSQNFSAPTSVNPSNLSCEGRVCLWNTTSVPDGEYFIRATIRDSSSSNSTTAGGTLVVENGRGSTATPPALSVEAPQANMTICESVQIKGFALNTSTLEPVTAVQVFIDGSFQDLVVPSDYSVAANREYPQLLSDSGFNFSLPVSSLSTGSHSLLIKAYSSNGGVAQTTIPVTKSIGCVDNVITDTAPSGIPLAGPVPPTGTPAPTPPAAPKITKATHDHTGSLTANISNLPSNVSGCYVKILVGARASSLSVTKRFPVSRTDITKGRSIFRARNVKVNAKKLKRIILGAQYACGEVSSPTSSVSVRLRGSGPISKHSQLQQTLKRTLRKVS